MGPHLVELMGERDCYLATQMEMLMVAMKGAQSADLMVYMTGAR